MKRLLVANRGEIARRIIRTARAMGIETVAVHSDADAGALHVREATLARRLPGTASADTYLRIDRLLAAAAATGADAVHPGYGFLSENADFAQAVVDAGLSWVGPPASAIRALGSKSGAKALAQAQGVPCLPGYQGEDQSVARFAAEAGRIGYPVMVKATAGGGGRGMRLVQEPRELEQALESARSEALSAFGHGELLVERALLAPRHVEIQVFADAAGRCIHLGERDCSVQRRHQKIIEESPSPAVDEALRERMGAAAVRLARAAGYVGAGTVEFLLQDGEFFLMEMNTRLQVEHPVTELRTGLDLVEWQLRVARGEPLPLAQQELRFQGHAIEVRLCAEDESFRPHAGQVLAFEPPPLEAGLRFDHAIFAGLEVPPFYDSMLGKLVAHAATREAAIERLAEALDRLCLLGLPSNRGLLAACLRHPGFRAGAALIPFLREQGDALREALAARERQELPRCAPAVLLPAAGDGALRSPFVRPARLRHRGAVLPHALREQGRHPPGAAGSAGATAAAVTTGAVDAAGAAGAAGVTEASKAAEAAEATPPAAASVRAVALGSRRWHVQSGTVDLFIEDASFDPPEAGGGGGGARELRAPFNGRVIAVHARPGVAVRQGDPLLVIESMKLEHAIAAPRDATVQELHVAPGQQAATSQLLVSFAPA